MPEPAGWLLPGGPARSASAKGGLFVSEKVFVTQGIFDQAIEYLEDYADSPDALKTRARDAHGVLSLLTDSIDTSWWLV